MHLDFGTLGSTISTRDKGREIRLAVEENVRARKKVTLDISKVDVMSSAFCDELFGKLSQIFDSQTIKELIEVRYPADEKRQTSLRNLIAKAVIDRRRMAQETEQTRSK